MADYRALRERFLRPDRGTTRGLQPTRRRRAAALAAAGPVLSEWEARPILAAYGIGTNAAGTLAGSAEEAVDAATAIGGPVALKVQSPDILHKTEAGAVALEPAHAPSEVRAAYDARAGAARAGMRRRARILGVLVQPMAPPGREVILGIKRDATFGPLLMVGLGGVHVEILKDIALAPVPLCVGEAREMLARLKGARLLDAHRGAPAADTDALADLMVRLSALRRRPRRYRRRDRSQPRARARARQGRVGGGRPDRETLS